MNSAGLPNGDWYFQVTDPSGTVRLSLDSINCRELLVVNNVVSGSEGACPHLDGSTNPYNESVTVQLSPYGRTPNFGGEYKVWLTPVVDYDASAAGSHFGFIDADSITDNFKLRTPPCVDGTSTCSPPPSPVITGFKWYDADTDGIFDNNEVTIPGWKIDALDHSTNLLFDTYTDQNGNYSVPVDSSNTFTISEVLPNATWIATACVGNPNQSLNSGTTCNSKTSATVLTGTNLAIAGPNFGNVCVGAGNGGGLTIGYWSNRNGAAEWVPIPFDNPYLVGPSGKSWQYMNFSSSTSYSAFRTWLLNASATNMAYMLSAQLAGMWENVNGGTTGPNGTRVPVDPSALIYLGASAGTPPGSCTKPTNAAGFATVQNVMNAASCALDTTAGENTTKGSATRAYEEWLKNGLDAANNNNSFVQPGPASCQFTTPY
jgi:hypothetical protein